MHTAQLYKLDLYKQFLIQSKQQVSKFNLNAAEIIGENQRVFGKAGIEIAEKQIGLLKVNFGRLSPKIVDNMIGLSSSGTKLYSLLEQSYPATVSKITDEIIKGTALNQNPLVIARNIKGLMDNNLSRAKTICRTESLNVLRETSKEAMQTSGVIKGLIRSEASDACDDCQELDGKHYDFEDETDFHPNCRASWTPDIE